MLDVLGLLALGLALAVPVAVIWLLAAQWRLAARVAGLERRLAELAPDAAPAKASVPSPSAAREAETSTLPAVGRRRPVEDEESASARPLAPRALAALAPVAAWLQAHWALAVSALSLALSGLFATQYAAESGMLSPGLRVAFAGAMGAALVAAGEWIRRRGGDEPGAVTAYLPSVFSGAGIVTLFGAVIAARALYGMIGPGTALAGLVAVAALAVALGWFYGPVLVAVGLLGASGAPFVVGGEAGDARLLHGYFGLVAVAGLAINALRRWRLIDALALAAPFAGACAVAWLAGGERAFLALVAALPIVAAVLTRGSLMPRIEGFGPIAARIARQPGAATRAAWFLAIVWGVAVVAIVRVGASDLGHVAPAAAGLLALFVLPAIWSRRTDAVLDLAALAAAGLLALAWVARPGWMSPEAAPLARPFEGPGWALLALLGAGLAMSLVAAARSAGSQDWRAHVWALAAACIAPSLVVVLEIGWSPARLLGPGAWAGVAMAIAAAATLLSARAARADGEDRFRAALGALVALSMIALALFVSTSSGALSVALGVLVLTATALDDRFDLPALSPFVQAGVAVLIWRGLVDPGIGDAVAATRLDVALLQIVPTALVAAAWLLSRGADRPAARAALESGTAVLAGLAATVAILRAVDATDTLWGPNGHWVAGLLASVWLLSAAASLRNAGLARQARAGAGPSLRHRLAQAIRHASAAVALLVAGALVALTLTFLHPLAGGQRVAGWIVVNTFLPGYLLPAAILLAASLRVPGLPRPVRVTGAALGGGLALHHAALAVAHAWRGPDLAAVPMGDGELWTYTAMLLAGGAALMVVSLQRGSRPLRLVANGLLLAAIAKVFLVDAPDLDGLVRAGSFLILGLSLAGLAWLNRLAMRGAAPS